MKANLKGALAQINLSWQSFEHNGKRLYKPEVVAVLKAGIAKGYETTDDFKEGEVDEILSQNRKEAQQKILR